jgi:hypothetical protein
VPVLTGWCASGVGWDDMSEVVGMHCASLRLLSDPTVLPSRQLRSLHGVEISVTRVVAEKPRSWGDARFVWGPRSTLHLPRVDPVLVGDRGYSCERVVGGEAERTRR